MANVTHPGICQQCGKSLPEQAGAGRVRRYCSATCRSAARRQRASAQGAANRGDVNDLLTWPVRKGIVDTVTSSQGGPDAAAGVTAGRDLVRQMAADGAAGRLEAIGLARAIVRGAEEGLALTVRQAREAGHTWAEIGRVLGTSRQAAFQRFGRPEDPRTGAPMVPALPDADARAMALFDDLAAGRWAAVTATFSADVAAKLDDARLAALWAQVIGMAGRHERAGAPLIYQAGDYTIADVPLYFEADGRTGRVSFDRGGRVCGLFFLHGARRHER